MVRPLEHLNKVVWSNYKMRRAAYIWLAAVLDVLNESEFDESLLPLTSTWLPLGAVCVVRSAPPRADNTEGEWWRLIFTRYNAWG